MESGRHTPATTAGAADGLAPRADAGIGADQPYLPGPAAWRNFYEYEADVYAITPEDEPAFRHRRELVFRLLPRRLEGPVLDVGCGDGALCEALAARAAPAAVPVVGTDLAWKRVGRARTRVPWLPLLQGSVYDLPFRDRSFPLVVCTDLLEHLDDPDRAVRELARVSGRHVLITVPYCITIEKTLCPHCGKDYFLYGHQHSFGEEGVARLARQAGLRVAARHHLIPMFECRRYKWCPPLKWLIRDHFKNSGTLGALLERG